MAPPDGSNRFLAKKYFLPHTVKRCQLSAAVKRCQLSAAVSCQCVIDVLDTLDSACTWSQLFSVKRCQALSMTLLSMSIDSCVSCQLLSAAVSCCQLAVNDTCVSCQTGAQRGTGSKGVGGEALGRCFCFEGPGPELSKGRCFCFEGPGPGPSKGAREDPLTEKSNPYRLSESLNFEHMKYPQQSSGPPRAFST